MNGDTAFPYVCPVCAQRFRARAGEDSLAAHWIESPACNVNRNAPLRTMTPEAPPLRLVEDDEEGP